MLVFRSVSDLEIPGLMNLTVTVLIVPILSMCVAFMGIQWGQSIFWPFAELIAGDSHYAISDDGILYGDLLFLWSGFSHFSMYHGQPVIKLWSASLPATVAFTLVPATNEDGLKISGILQKHLEYSMDYSPGFIQGATFPALMAGISALFISLAMLTFKLPTGIALILNTVIIYLLILIGGKLLMRLIFGGKTLPAPLA